MDGEGEKKVEEEVKNRADLDGESRYYFKYGEGRKEDKS